MNQKTRCIRTQRQNQVDGTKREPSESERRRRTSPFSVASILYFVKCCTEHTLVKFTLYFLYQERRQLCCRIYLHYIQKAVCSCAACSGAVDMAVKCRSR
jgi:hypothetical protein